MKATHMIKLDRSSNTRHAMLATAVAAAGLFAMAQHARAATSADDGAAHGAHHGGAAAAPAAPVMPAMPAAAIAPAPSQSAANPPPPADAMDHGDMKMQGGSAPPDARDPNAYSGGYTLESGPYALPGPRLLRLSDEHVFGTVLVDRLEWAHSSGGDAGDYDATAWFGNSYNRLVIKAEGEVARSELVHARTELLWGHAIAPYWDTQLGVRNDSGDGLSSRNWLAFGVQGLAPYWFELDLTGYVGNDGRTALRLSSEYELLLTQKLDPAAARRGQSVRQVRPGQWHRQRLVRPESGLAPALRDHPPVRALHRRGLGGLVRPDRGHGRSGRRKDTRHDLGGRRPILVLSTHRRQAHSHYSFSKDRNDQSTQTPFSTDTGNVAGARLRRR